MAVIWKFPLARGVNILDVPQMSSILTVQVQDGVPCAWVLVDTENRPSRCKIDLIGTGEEFRRADYLYIGTVLLEWVYHAFLDTRPQREWGRSVPKPRVEPTTRFAKYLRDKRAKAGVDMKTVAQACGVSVQHMCDLEAGRRNPPTKMAIKLGLSKSLNIPLSLLEYECFRSWPKLTLEARANDETRVEILYILCVLWRDGDKGTMKELERAAGKVLLDLTAKRVGT